MIAVPEEQRCRNFPTLRILILPETIRVMPAPLFNRFVCVTYRLWKMPT